MPTFQQDVYIAIRTDGQTGTGTWSDPYDGSTTTKFDGVMNGLTTGQTVRLLPGTFPTLGYHVSAGWAAKSGTRIVGSGIGVTTLQLFPANSQQNYAVGIDFGTVELSGFELSDLTIDCNLAYATTTSTSAAAVRVRGKHVFLRRIKVINYGTKDSTATVSVITAAGEDSENCVIEDCVVDSHPAAHAGKAIMYAFEGSTNGHRFCAIRNCTGRGQDTFEQPPTVSTLDFAAISPGLGLGTIIEGNQFANVYYGIYGSAQPAKDIAIWNNVFRNVFNGLFWDEGSGAAVGRFVVTDNIIEISRALAGPFGLHFSASSADKFADLVLRKNFIRQVADTAHSLRTDMTGISVSYATHLIAENNIVSDAGTSGSTRPVVYNNCGSVKFFNNESVSGTLERGYNTATSLSQNEVEDAVQDVLLPV